MFTRPFVDASVADIVNTIRQEGFYFVESALPATYIDPMLQEVDFETILVNNNDVGTVISGRQRFLTHCLVKSKKAYDVITAQKVLDVCNAYFTDRYQLINHRFCQTRHGFHMPWHTDNNLQTGSQLSGKHAMPGLLFLFYLSAENVSPFQYLRGSQAWSRQHGADLYFSDEWIDTHHGQDIMNLVMPRGSLVICDIHVIHRAAPFRARHHQRNVLLFQVDQVGQGHLGHGEQNLINTEFIDRTSPELFSYLGFGIKRDYPAFPHSSVATMPVQDLLRLQQHIFPLMLQAAFKQMVKTLVPGSVMVHLKRRAWAHKTRSDSAAIAPPAHHET